MRISADRNAQKIRQSNDNAVDLQTAMANTIDEMVLASSKVAASQVKESKINHALAMEVQSSLESIRGREVEMLLQTLADMHRGLVRTQLQLGGCAC